MNKLLPVALCLGVTLLAGCAKDDSELRAWIAEVKSREKPKVEPLPILKPYEKFVYQASHLRDPFEDTLRRQAQEQAQRAASAQGKSTVHPPVNRRPEPLEAFPLDALRMVGTLEQKGQTWAVISAPDGSVTRVKVGNYMGQNYGRITRIDDYEITLTEIVPDGAGGWMERNAALAIEEPG